MEMLEDRHHMKCCEDGCNNPISLYHFLHVLKKCAECYMKDLKTKYNI